MLAVAAICLAFAGAVAIYFALVTLFGIKMDWLAHYVLIIAACLVAPVYWLSTIPRLGDYDSKRLTQPDFVSQAMGFLGQFILVPILSAYALILLAYAVQIIVLRQLPQGRLGWMVLAFVTAGAATYLVVYPAFMRQRLAVRLFRRWWFWLTLIPLALVAIAIATRLGAYGWTSERVLLVAGGVWAAWCRWRS